MNNLIFGYVLEDAWGRPITSIAVYDRKIENVMCTFLEYNTRKIEKTTFLRNVLSDIKSLAISEVLDLERIENPLVLDGVINQFTMGNGIEENNISCFNLWKFEQTGFYEAPNANILYDYFLQVKDICIKNGIDKKFFNLDIK